jgi:hypothetical protein
MTNSGAIDLRKQMLDTSTATGSDVGTAQSDLEGAVLF